MIIEQPARFLRWMYPHALWRMGHQKKVVYLTFDDGPIPEATPFILDVLDRYNAKATFFMVGDNAAKYPHLLKEVRNRGHRIGNHTHNHVKGISMSAWKYLANVKQAEEILRSDHLFRPPHGWMGLVKYRTMRYLGWRIVMWELCLLRSQRSANRAINPCETALVDRVGVEPTSTDFQSVALTL